MKQQVRVAIDLTYVNNARNGTHVYAIQFLSALARQCPDYVTLTVIVLNELQQEHLQPSIIPYGIILTLDEVRNMPLLRFDLIHRPAQINRHIDTQFLRAVASRCLVTYLDSIAFSNPNYFPDHESWLAYCREIRYAFEIVDGVFFISQEAHKDAARNGLELGPEREFVTYCGVDHVTTQLQPIQSLAEKQLVKPPYILVLGTNFTHKNRIFSLQILCKLREIYHWNGSLVFAGPEVSDGGSYIEEWDYLRRHPELRRQVRYLGSVTERQKQQLIHQAALVLYPSLHEGFGMVPFEAAALDTPALTLRVSALAEVLGEHPQYIETLDPVEAAHTVWSLLTNRLAAKTQIQHIYERGIKYTWDEVATATWQAYWQIINLPPRNQTLHVDDHIDKLNTITSAADQLLKFAERKPLRRIDVWRDRFSAVRRTWQRGGFLQVYHQILYFARYLYARRAMRKYQ